MPFGLQPTHLIVIVVVALIIFGPTRLPEIGRSLGRAINEFRAGASEMTRSFQEEASRPVSPSGASAPALPPDGSRVFCSACGSANDPEARFCSRCGAAFLQPQPETDASV